MNNDDVNFNLINELLTLKNWQEAWELVKGASPYYSAFILSTLAEQNNWLPSDSQERNVFLELALLALNCKDEPPSLEVFKPKTNKQLNLSEINAITDIEISPDLTSIVTGHIDGNLYLWNLDNSVLGIVSPQKDLDSVLGKNLHKLNHAIYDITFSFNGQFLVFAEKWLSSNGKAEITVWLFSLYDKSIYSLYRNSYNSRGIASSNFSFTHDNKLVIGATQADKLLWELDSKQIVQFLPDEDSLEPAYWDVGCMASHPTEYSVVCSNDGGSYLFWQLNDNKMRIIRRLSVVSINCISYSPDGNFIISGGSNGTIAEIYIMSQDGIKIATKSSHYSSVKVVKISPSNLTLATGHHKGIEFWQFNNYSLIKTTEVHNGDVLSIVFSSDGQRMISADDTGLIIEWDSNLSNLAYVPISTMDISDLESLRQIKKNFINYANDKHWLDFTEALMSWHFQGKIDVANDSSDSEV